MRNRIMILCTFCAIAIFSSAQEKFSIQGIANEELNNQLLYLCLMDDGEKAKEVVLDSAKVKKGKFSFSGVRQTPNIALIKDRDGETYPLILEKGKIVINLTTRTVGGTPLNDTLDVAWKGMQSVINNNKQIVKSNISLVMSQKSGESFREALKRDTAFAAIWRRNVEIDLAQRDSRFCRRTPKQFGGSISVIFKRSVYISQSIGRYDERGFFCVCAACIGER